MCFSYVGDTVVLQMMMLQALTARSCLFCLGERNVSLIGRVD